MKDFFRNAFALDDGRPCVPSDEQRAVLDRLVSEVVRRRLAGPAIAFLEMSRPMNALGSAAIHFFTPVASVLANPVSLRHFADFLEKRGSVEVLVGMIEAADAGRRAGCCEGSPSAEDVQDDGAPKSG